jgi:hypothetical protein
MKLQVPADFKGLITDADGISYNPDDKYQVDIPDGKIPHDLYGIGFYPAIDEPAKTAKAKPATE